MMNISNDRLPKFTYIELPDELAAHVSGGGTVRIHKVHGFTLKRGTFGTNYFNGKLLTARDLRVE